MQSVRCLTSYVAWAVAAVLLGTGALVAQRPFAPPMPSAPAIDVELAWLADPADVKPGATMPDLGLTDEQINDLVAYLKSLE